MEELAEVTAPAGVWNVSPAAAGHRPQPAWGGEQRLHDQHQGVHLLLLTSSWPRVAFASASAALGGFVRWLSVLQAVAVMTRRTPSEGWK